MRISPKQESIKYYGVIFEKYFVNPMIMFAVPSLQHIWSCQISICLWIQCSSSKWNHRRRNFDSSSLRQNVAEQLRQTWILVVSRCGSKVFWVFPMLFNQWWWGTDQMTHKQIMTHFILNTKLNNLSLTFHLRMLNNDQSHTFCPWSLLETSHLRDRTEQQCKLV